jgi:hypothetical protein
MRLISLVPAVLAVVLFCAIPIPVFASGDDKPTATVSETSKNAAPKPDREKKVYTNDDIERIRANPRRSLILVSQSQNQTPETPRDANVTVQPVSPEKDPLWYAEQVATLEAELGQLADKEERLREFRSSGSASMLPGVRLGLQLNAPCDGITTDNEIEQLALRRQDIEEQLASLEDIAHENDMPPAIIRDAPAILASAQKPLSAEEERELLAERQAQLADELNATQEQLAAMSEEAAALGANLLPPTPGYGGNMTTDLIERLDNRANEIQSALERTEDAARRVGPVLP